MTEPKFTVGSVVNVREGVLIKRLLNGVIVEDGWVRDGLRPRHFGVQFDDDFDVKGFDVDELELADDTP